MSKSPVVHSGPEILGGTVGFKGTRVLLANFVVYLEGGCSFEEVLEDFPSAARHQAIEGLEAVRAWLTEAAA